MIFVTKDKMNKFHIPNKEVADEWTYFEASTFKSVSQISQ